MNFDQLMEIQSALNDYTLAEKNVQLVDHYSSPSEGNANESQEQIVLASMALARREGEFVRHHSALIQLLAKYQWAGNRELLELAESIIKRDTLNNKIEIVDIMHFDLTLLALTKTTSEEIQQAIDARKEERIPVELSEIKHVRGLLDGLQLPKWWSSNQVSIAEIRRLAIAQFARLLLHGEQWHFDSMEEIVETYNSKVQVNYQRIQQNYDHVKDAEAGNANVASR